MTPFDISSYSPYVISISLTPYVLLLELLLAACAAYLLVAIAADRKQMGSIPVTGRNPVRNFAVVLSPEIRALRRRLSHSRMTKMLRRLKVDPAEYLRRTPAAQAQAQLDTCSSCAHQFLCDQALASNRAANVDLSFCPNRASILPLARAA